MACIAADETELLIRKIVSCRHFGLCAPKFTLDIMLCHICAYAYLYSESSVNRTVPYRFGTLFLLRVSSGIDSCWHVEKEVALL